MECRPLRTRRAGAPQGCIGREGAPEAVRQAVGGGCQSGLGRLLSVTNAIEACTCRQGQWLGIDWAPCRGGTSAPANASLAPPATACSAPTRRCRAPALVEQ